MMKMSVEKAVQRLGLPVNYIHHCSLAEGKSSAVNYDVVMCPLNFIEMFKDAANRGVSVIGVRNVMSDKEVEEKLISQGVVNMYMR
jgi:PTS system ascorbate-specific IIB component